MAKAVTGSTFTRRGLADAFGVHMQTITGWEQEGMPVELRGTRGRPSLYSLKACLAWFVERELKARGATDLADLSPQQERAMLDRKRREDLELRLKVRRGELVELAEAGRDLANVAMATKARLRRIPDAVADRVVGAAPRGAAFVKAIILGEIDDALRELARKGEEPADQEGMKTSA